MQEAANGFAAEEAGRNLRVREPDPPDRGDLTSGLREPHGHIVDRQ